MANCLAPGFIKLTYTANGHQHIQVVGIYPDNSTGSILRTAGGSTNAFDAAIDAFVAKFAALFDTSSHYDGAELYTQADCSSAPVLQFVYDLGGPVAGTGPGTAKQWQQNALTFKTSLGGRFKLQFMESSISANDSKAALSSFSADGIANLRDYVLGSSNVLYARDNSWPAFGLNRVTKTNDKLRKKFLNP